MSTDNKIKASMSEAFQGKTPGCLEEPFRKIYTMSTAASIQTAHNENL